MRGILTRSEIKMHAIFLLILLPMAVLCYNKELHIGKIPSFWLMLMLILMPIVSYIEIPIITFRSLKNEELSRFAPMMEEIYGVPVVEELAAYKGRVFNTTVTLNLGGALIPILAIVYLLLTQPDNTAIQVMLITIVAVTLLANMVSGVGIVVPDYIGMVPIPFALIVAPQNLASIVFIAGIGGILLGTMALTATFNKEKYGSAFMNIGGAGSFKAIYITALIASLLSYFT